ncbi:Anthranilate N-benzoyltransferase protein 1 [Phytophthora cinnamomi]|uniref:Anthranilate N-benzoyltransferase protein 1 n=1 Tax=Phytophthora cinnamomi TaxID=4785 RepID=UPI00355A38DA|nr:Anthranilate N-benzoyltransferase protein 1 [Phytophthora cinnamomi]
MNAATVKVTGELSLRCADETSVQKLESPVLLGPLDHVAQNFTPITVVFVYRREGGDLVPLDRLRKALSRLLDYYPHLTGRVVMDPNDRTPRIEQLGKGAKLFTAECSQPLAAFEAVGDDDAPSSLPRLIVTNLPDGGNALLPSFDPTEAGLTRDPILAVQHTRFACGGVSIGFCLRHIICDACGFFQLVRDLAELYRGFRDGCIR